MSAPLDPKGIWSLGLDFDGTCVTGGDGEPMRWRKGARELIRGAKAAGVRVVLHTCRATVHPDPGGEDEVWLSGEAPERVQTGWRMRAEMLAFLAAEGVLDLVEIWEAPGKPLVDVFADDRAEGNDLVVVAATLGIRFGYADQHGPQVPGPLGEQERPQPSAV